MTDNKRFRLVNELGDYHIKDGDDELCYDLCSPSMAKENWNNVVNRLNELADENLQLKKEIVLLQNSLHDCNMKSRKLAISEMRDTGEVLYDKETGLEHGVYSPNYRFHVRDMMNELNDENVKLKNSLKEFGVFESNRIKGAVVTNDDFSVTLHSNNEAYMVCNMLNRFIRSVKNGDV